MQYISTQARIYHAAKGMDDSVPQNYTQLFSLKLKNKPCSAQELSVLPALVGESQYQAVSFAQEGKVC